MVAYCDGHTKFLRDDISYLTYQQLLTSDGRKCVDPRDWKNVGAPIDTFRNAPPLSEADYE